MGNIQRISQTISKTLKAILIALLAAATLPSTACNAQSRVSGIYVVCGTNDGAMLRLTQAANGQITGVISIVTLDNSGNVKADSSSIMGGTLDASQLTLTVHPGIFGTNISGTKSGNTIRLQNIDHDGNVSVVTFIRNSDSGFNDCASQLQQKSATIKLNRELILQLQQFRQATHEAETWIQTSQLRVSRIPEAEDHYNRIQNAVLKLIEREKTTQDPIDRSLLSTDVNQANIDGDLFDIDVDQAWRWPTESQFKPISQQLSSCIAACDEADATKPGIKPTIKDAWESSCRNIRAEQIDFQSLAQKAMEHRSELKTFQAHAKSLREATLNQAENLAK